MIYVMSQKFLRKHIEKLVYYNDYFIIDGENYAVTGKMNDKSVSISAEFRNAHPMGGYCPEVRLYDLLRKIDKKEEISHYKFDREMEYFLEDKPLIAAISQTAKTLIICGSDIDINIFVALPNKVYKHLSGVIIDRMRYILNEKSFDSRFIYNQNDIKENIKMLKRSISNKDKEKLRDIIDRVDKKYKIKGKKEDDEYSSYVDR